MATRGEADDGASGPGECAAAQRLWDAACAALQAPDAARAAAWRELEDCDGGHHIWHCLRNCVNYQAGVWAEVEARGAHVSQPAAFQLALVLRHAPPERAARLLPGLLRHLPHHQDLTSYILALVTEEELRAWSAEPPSPAAAPARDLRLFADCELCVLAAPAARYRAHAGLVRAEYRQLDEDKFVELRIKVLDQLSKIPKLFTTPEFEHLEAAARENIEREIASLKKM